MNLYNWIKSNLWKDSPHKPLTKGQNFTGGRNNNGRITSRHIGGGSKHKYRIIDFFRKKKNVPATVERIEYDPNRTAHIALISYKDNEKAYIISPQGLKQGDIIESIFKRFNNLKNSSNLLPGHGGFFDRFDSFIFAIIPYSLLQSFVWK